MHSIRRITLAGLALATAIALVPTAGLADSHEPARPFAYGIYYECDTSTQEQADHIMKHLFKPVYDQGVEDGVISGWGWMSHMAGGKWRRVSYMIAPTLEGVLEAVNVLNTKVGEADPMGANRLQQLCPTHDDYIWRWVAGSSGDAAAMTEDRGEVAMSTYWICDMGKEAGLDAMVKDKLAALWNEQVAAGNISSWAWFEHSIGGKYRRLGSQTGKDLAGILKARDAVIAKLASDHPDVMSQMTTSCSEHQDYLWEVQMETP